MAATIQKELDKFVAVATHPGHPLFCIADPRDKIVIIHIPVHYMWHHIPVMGFFNAVVFLVRFVREHLPRDALADQNGLIERGVDRRVRQLRVWARIWVRVETVGWSVQVC
ncbi:hypothetical protein COP2_009073 [Malus domestica]